MQADTHPERHPRVRGRPGPPPDRLLRRRGRGEEPPLLLLLLPRAEREELEETAVLGRDEARVICEEGRLALRC